MIITILLTKRLDINLFSFYLFFIIFLKSFNLINSSGQLLFQLTTFNISSQQLLRVELCANEFRWSNSPKNEWGKDCKFGRAEVFLRGNGTIFEDFNNDQKQKKTSLLSSTASISLPFSHFWRQSFTLELRLWHDNEILLEQIERIFPLPVGSGWRTIRSNFVLNKKEEKQRKLEILFRVDCTENYFGSGCDVYCKLNDWERLLNKTECNIDNGLKICKKGWIGNNCNLKDDNILKSVEDCNCINGGKCVDNNKCICPTGYWGNYCEKCIPSSRCKGYCRQRPGECSCPEGKGGQFCEKDLIFCTKNSPCQNGGICQNNPEGNYNCKCLPGFNGKNCEKRITNCEEKPCYNGAKCINSFSSLSGFRCLCSPSQGLFGQFCEIKAPNGCRDLPCQNGGSCADLNNYYLFNKNYSSKNDQNISFKCLCPEGWTGNLCEKPFGRCTENPCQNGGSCISDKEGNICLCPIGWSGINCQINLNLNNCLINNPCLNGGTCINNNDLTSFHCFCNEHFNGQICQNKIERRRQLKSDCIKCLFTSKQQNNNLSNNLLLNILCLLLALIALLLAFLSLFCFILRFLPFQIFLNNLKRRNNKNKIINLKNLQKRRKKYFDSENSSPRYITEPTTTKINSINSTINIYDEINENNNCCNNKNICQHRF